ncbi:MAG: hypothetical protein ABIJ09_24650 [Pseudomonadota bacterium]
MQDSGNIGFLRVKICLSRRLVDGIEADLAAWNRDGGQRMAKKKLGEILIEGGVIDEEQLNSALAYQRQWGHRLGVAMVAKGFISEGLLTKVLSESLGIPMVDLSRVSISKDSLRLVPVGLCESHDLIPIDLKIEKGRKHLTVAMSDPLNLAALEELEFTTGATVHPVLAQISSINQAVQRYYRGDRVQIAPLRFQIERPGQDNMTLFRRGGVEEVVEMGPDGAIPPVVELSDEVTDRTALAELEAARRLGRNNSVISQVDIERIDALERKFWALMRTLARKGYVTKEEFLAELKRTDW